MNDVLQRLRALEQTVDLLNATVSRIRQVPSDQFRHREIRVGRAYNDGAYPGSGNVFPVTFVDATFTESSGSQTPTVVERNTANIAYPINMHGNYIPAIGTMVPVIRDNGRWFTWYTPSETGSLTDDDKFVRVKSLSGTPATGDPINKDTGECYWSGALVTLAGSPNLCDDPWTEGTAIWIADASRFDKTKSLRFNEVYHARKVADSFTPSGQSARALYMIRHQETEMQYIKITGAAACSIADELSLSECIFDGLIQIASPTGATMCSPFTDGDSVFVINMSGCSSVLREGERYLGKYIGRFASTAEATTKSVYGVYGSARMPWWGNVTSAIDNGASGNVTVAAGSDSGETRTVRNEYCGKLLANLKVLVVPARGNSNTWTVAPMPLKYDGMTDSAITAGSTGTVSIYQNGSDTSQDVTAKHRWTHGSVNIASGTKVKVEWTYDQQEWIVDVQECV